MNDLRLELRFKNATLYNALRAKFPPTNSRQRCADIKEAAKQIGVDYSCLLGLLNLHQTPWSADGNPRPSADKLSLFLEIDCEILFPRHLYSAVFPKTLAAEVDGSRYVSLLEARQQKLLPVSTEDLDQFDRGAAAEALEKALATLKPRQQRILKKRFGLDGDGEKLLEEIAEDEHVTRERIRQIEQKALRLLRHPSRSRQLRPLLERDIADD